MDTESTEEATSGGEAWQCGVKAVSPSTVQKAINEAARAAGVKLKARQRTAVEAFVKGSDVFIALPTGYGKSIIYGILPLVFDSLRGRTGSMIIVVSPLIGLMIR